jgi:hypothetical protein
MLSTYQIARIAHEVNRAYCKALGDNTQPSWEHAPDWQQRSALDGVAFHVMTPDASPSASHDNWLEQKRIEGWQYGPVKNAETKEHPCFLPYESLPLEQRAKDFIFKAVVRAIATTT